jgi:hypothetical protein
MPSWDFGKVQKGFEWICQTRRNPLFPNTFWAFFKSLEGGK